uniref:Type I restriction enzyme endonuclease subunit n=1 Tax=Candidatus Kentrum sp. SD TaxID=2126332 RepID=A0A451BQX9_9GAMM|nr:MAG: type I restriction enzyme, R subunit [Candidatus Kentron sp. SD]
MHVDIPRFEEKYLSQIPALEQLINLGFEYLTPEQALLARQGKVDNVLLEGILRKQLKEINRIPYKGKEYRFSEENLQLAVQKLKNMEYDGPRKTNEAIYERLTLGLVLGQTIEGNAKSFALRYIDWRDWKKNSFHVTPELMVACPRSLKTASFDIVLFVNGIPLAVIECAPPSVPVDQGVSRLVRSQRGTHIPRLFHYAQLLLGINRDSARFGTTGTPVRFWSIWREPDDPTTQNTLLESIRRIAAPRTKDLLFSGDFASSRKFFDANASAKHEITGQTKAIHALCRPKRLLDLIYKFMVFDNGVKKIARYQQYFAVKRTLSHIRVPDATGRRRGGIVWHTQGSGKSLTMVMLARSLAEEPDISDPRIVLITDRKDLDKQIKDTFAACDMAPQRSRTGRDLLELVSRKKAGLITTLVHKFDKALNIRKYQDHSIDIFMLIDESHRTQFGAFAARMRQMFPNACYLGFTGTPLMKKEKNNFEKFGGLIDHYTIDQAIRDKAIVPLLYEARHVEMRADEKAMDAWFRRHTRGFTETEKIILKKKYACAEWLDKTERVLYLRALDISRHFRNIPWGGGYKGQLVAPDRSTALAYHRHLGEIGLVSSEVIISAPGRHETRGKRRFASMMDSPGKGNEPKDHVMEFWREMMKRHGSEAEYNNRIIEHFKYGDDPKILIVVDKLQTGFDAPRNAVLYLTRALRGHALLQTIARVNRIHEDEGGSKEFGLIVDYVGILGELDKALSRYSALDDFDEEDLIGALAPIQEELKKLPQRHASLGGLFMKAHHDEEIRETLLRDEAIRNTFHQRLTEFSKTLELALSNDRFMAETSAAERKMYKDDLRRFRELKKTVDPRHAAGPVSNHRDIDHCNRAPRIEEMPDTHIQADEVTQINPPALISPFEILNENPFCQVKVSRPIYGSNQTAASKADAIAEVAQKLLTEHEEWDPAFHGKFSKIIQQVIDDYKARKLSDVEYLDRMTGIYIRVEKRGDRDVPLVLRDSKNAAAFYRMLRPYFTTTHREKTDLDSMLQTHDVLFFDATTTTHAAKAIDDILHRHWKVRFWDDPDAIKQAMNDIDDYLYDEVNAIRGIELSPDQMDEIIDKIMRIARRQTPSPGG